MWKYVLNFFSRSIIRFCFFVITYTLILRKQGNGNDLEQITIFNNIFDDFRVVIYLYLLKRYNRWRGLSHLSSMSWNVSRTITNYFFSWKSSYLDTSLLSRQFISAFVNVTHVTNVTDTEIIQGFPIVW